MDRQTVRDTYYHNLVALMTDRQINWHIDRQTKDTILLNIYEQTDRHTYRQTDRFGQMWYLLQSL